MITVESLEKKIADRLQYLYRMDSDSYVFKDVAEAFQETLLHRLCELDYPKYEVEDEEDVSEN